jgi:hypothetical protein
VNERSVAAAARFVGWDLRLSNKKRAAFGPPGKQGLQSAKLYDNNSSKCEIGSRVLFEDHG